MLLHKPTNILYIQKPSGGGSVVALYEMIRMLDRTRFNPIVLCYENNRYTRTLEQVSQTVHYLKPETRNSTADKKVKLVKRKSYPKFAVKMKSFFVDDFKVAKRITSVIENNAIDIIHHNNDIFLSRQGVLANRKTRRPQICHYRSLKKYKGDWMNLLIDRVLVKRVNFHVHISNAVQKHFADNLSLNKSTSKVVRDIVDAKKFSNDVDTKELKREFIFSSTDIIIANIGRIIPWKGQDVFIKAIAGVINANENVRALIVGPYEYGVGDQAFYEELKQLVESFHLNDKIIFTGHRDDIPQLINLSDIIVHTATEPEPQGLIIVEALMAGKPVIVSDAGGAAELIINNEGGLKVKPGNVNELKEGILKMISKLDTPAKGTPSILLEFNPTQQINEIHNVYEQLIKENV